MRARFYVALRTLVLPYRTGDVIYPTQAGTDSSRHTQIYTHTHRFTPSSKQHRLGHVRGTVKVFASYHCDLMNFSIFGVFQHVVSLFLVPQVAIFGQQEYLQTVSQVLQDGTLVISLVSLLSDLTRRFRFILYSLVFFLITKYLTELDVLLCLSV